MLRLLIEPELTPQEEVAERLKLLEHRFGEPSVDEINLELQEIAVEDSQCRLGNSS